MQPITSRGAVCAGSAQVTFIEWSYYTGCISIEEQTPQKTHTKTQTKPKAGSNLLRNSCGLAGIVREGETGQ